jgi:hypothetical protein
MSADRDADCRKARQIAANRDGAGHFGRKGSLDVGVW